MDRPKFMSELYYIPDRDVKGNGWICELRDGSYYPLDYVQRSQLPWNWLLREVDSDLKRKALD